MHAGGILRLCISGGIVYVKGETSSLFVVSVEDSIQDMS